MTPEDESALPQAAALRKSVPHARLRWQRGRLALTLSMRRASLREAEAEVEEARSESVQTEFQSRRQVELAQEERDAKHDLLLEEKSKTQLLTTALSQASDSVAALQAKQSSLVLTAREATFKLRELEQFMKTEASETATAQSTVSRLQGELQQTRWELTQAADTEAKLREQLFIEQSQRSQAAEALEAAQNWRSSDEVRAELRRRAAASTAEAAAAAHAAVNLSHKSLQEAAEARAERARLESRCKELEQRLKLGSGGGGLAMRPSASMPIVPKKVPSPTDRLHAAGRLPMLPPGSPGSITPTALHQLIRDLDSATGPNKLASAASGLPPAPASLPSAHKKARPGTPSGLAIGTGSERQKKTPLALNSSPGAQTADQAGRRPYGSLAPSRPSSQVASGLIRYNPVERPPSGVAGGPPASMRVPTTATPP